MDSKRDTYAHDLGVGRIDDRETLPEKSDGVETLRDVAGELEAAALAGTPSIADWYHRAVDFRILDRVLGGLDHPVASFTAVFPANWASVPTEVRDRIPGNARNNHMRLVARVRRAIGLFRPEADPWSALQILADVETPKTAGIVGEIRWRAERDGLAPSDVDTSWIAHQLAAFPPEKEAQYRNIYLCLVRLSKRPRVRRAGLLRDDLTLPTTARQHRRAVVLPDWLQAIRDASDRRTRNGLDRIWRTVLHHGLVANTPDDVLGLIDEGKLQHDAAQRVEPIQLQTWRGYVQSARKALLSRVDDPSRYSEKVRHVRSS